MRVNADFSQSVVVRPEQRQWITSPQNGVERVLLDRIGAEKARATSLVRYAPHSKFPAHVHPAGEEILVLEGVFSYGDHHFPAGSYIRNPPGSVHQPWTDAGALLFVKLMQMKPDADQTVHINTCDPQAWSQRNGVAVLPLFAGDEERVELIRLQAAQPFDLSSFAAGAEILVLEGELAQGSEHYLSGTWLRMPAGSVGQFQAGQAGALFYIKTGHLASVIGMEIAS